ncbi:MAG: GGDEF domain-containing protein [Pseudomonadota bacterium]
MKFVLGAFNLWHFDNLKHHYAADRTRLATARMLSAILLGVAVIIAVFLVINVIVDDAIMDDRTKAFFVPLEIAVITVMLCSYTFLVRGYYQAGLAVFSSMAGFSVIISILMTGGFPYSVATPVMLIVPVVAFCLHGKVVGLWTTFLFPFVMLSNWAIFQIFEIKLPDFTSQALPELNIMGTIFITYSIIMFIIYSYDQNYLLIKRQLQEEKEKYAKLANRDGLTGLYNSRYLNSSLQTYLEIEERVAVLFIDLDDFKPVNDTYGHDVGDHVLRTVARRIRNNVRENDIVARVGGDEFVVLMCSGFTNEEVNEVKSRLFADISRTISDKENTYNIGASMGSAIYPDQAHDAETLLKMADQSMYDDKCEKEQRQKGDGLNSKTGTKRIEAA